MLHFGGTTVAQRPLLLHLRVLEETKTHQLHVWLGCCPGNLGAFGFALG